MLPKREITEQKKATEARVVVLGHRGEGCTNRNPDVVGKPLQPRTDPYYNGRILPENSLSAFESAFKHGADGVECDVHLSKDGVPMIAHDNLLARNVDGYHYWTSPDEEKLGSISDYTCAELRKPAFYIGNNEPLPMLEELLQLALRCNPQHLRETGRNLELNIELKGDVGIAKAVHTVLTRFLKAPGCPFKKENFLFNSFDEPNIAAMKALDPEMHCALNIFPALLFAEKDGQMLRKKGYKPEALTFLAKVTRLYGIDMTTSDLDPAIVGPFCRDQGIPLNLALNALHVLQEAKEANLPEASWPELEREKLEVLKLVKLSQDYGITVYYKSDNPGKILEFLRKLEVDAKAKLKSGEEISSTTAVTVLTAFSKTVLDDKSTDGQTATYDPRFSRQLASPADKETAASASNAADPKPAEPSHESPPKKSL